MRAQEITETTDYFRRREQERKKEQGVAEGAKWRKHPDAYDVDDEGNKTPRNPNSPKFGYDPLQRRADTAGDAKTPKGKAAALKTSLKMAKGQQGVAEGVAIVKQDYDLDQMVYVLDVDGQKVSFTYWDYEDDFNNPDIKDIYQQAQEQLGKKLSPEQVKEVARAVFKSFEQGVAEGLPQTLRKVVPGYAKREIDKKMDAGKFGKTDADKDANFQRYKKIQDKLKEQGVAEDDAGDLEQRIIAKIEKEKQRLAKLKQTDPEAYKREMAKHKTSSRIPPVSTF